MWVIVKPPKQKQYILGIVYRPPKGNQEAFRDKLEFNLDLIKEEFNTEIFLTGDFNVNLLDKDNDDGDLLMEMTLSYDLIKKIDNPTRYSRLNNPTLIDHFYTNSDSVNE